MPRLSALLPLLPIFVIGSGRSAIANDWPFTHLRVTQPQARAIVEDAVRESPTVRRLLGKLETTDVVVYVNLTPFLSLATSRIAFISAHEQRYLSLGLNERNQRDDLIVYFAHELEHVLEVAAAPGVRDSASFEKLYRSIGRPSGEQEVFETDEALAVASRVRSEIHGARHATAAEGAS